MPGAGSNGPRVRREFPFGRSSLIFGASSKQVAAAMTAPDAAVRLSGMDSGGAAVWPGDTGVRSQLIGSVSGEETPATEDNSGRATRLLTALTMTSGCPFGTLNSIGSLPGGIGKMRGDGAAENPGTLSRAAGPGRLAGGKLLQVISAAGTRLALAVESTPVGLVVAGKGGGTRGSQKAAATTAAASSAAGFVPESNGPVVGRPSGKNDSKVSRAGSMGPIPGKLGTGLTASG